MGWNVEINAQIYRVERKIMELMKEAMRLNEGKTWHRMKERHDVT
jgi:hypothetical protein